jgi:hypothetical protein
MLVSVLLSRRAKNLDIATRGISLPLKEIASYKFNAFILIPFLFIFVASRRLENASLYVASEDFFYSA